MTRVLIVEDDPAIRSLIVDVLTDEGFESLEADNGKTGLELARSERPDLVLMDLNLPILDGVAAIKALKADDQTKRIRTIAMSAGTNLRLHAEQLPVDGILAKPFDLDTLLAIVVIESHQSESDS